MPVRVPLANNHPFRWRFANKRDVQPPSFPRAGTGSDMRESRGIPTSILFLENVSIPRLGRPYPMTMNGNEYSVEFCPKELHSTPSGGENQKST